MNTVEAKRPKTETKMQLLVLVVCLGMTHGLNNGLALTPPMGWLSWERFRCNTDCKNFPDSCISENLYMTMADRMVADGYRDAGYEYVNLDDCWLANERDPLTGKLIADPIRFPSGIKALADYVHGKGLKLGIYEDFGTKTCAGFPGSEFYMELDANTFAEWNVDMVKFDGCNSAAQDIAYGYTIMQFFLNKTGHPMLFSCEWPVYDYMHKMQSNYTLIRQTCNLWRNFDDVTDAWWSVSSVIDYYGKNPQNFSAFSGPGGWADPDELVVGDFGLSYYQQKAQLGMWAMFAAPLLMSVDLRTIAPDAKALLLNKNIIAINQDPLGVQAVMLYQAGSISVWLKPLSVQGSFAVAFFNKDDQGTPSRIQIRLGDISLNNPSGYNVTEVFDNRPMGQYKPNQNLVIDVDPTSIFLIKAVPW